MPVPSAARMSSARSGARIRNEASRRFLEAIRRDDLLQAVDIAKASFLDIIRDDKVEILRRLRRIPAERLAQHPLLLLFLALLYAQLPHADSAAMHYFQLAERVSRESANATAGVEHALILAAQAAVLRVSGHDRLALDKARLFRVAYDQLSLHDQHALGPLRIVSFAQVATTFLFGGDLSAAEETLKRAVGLDDLHETGLHFLTSMLSGIEALGGSVSDSLRTWEAAEAEQLTSRPQPYYQQWSLLSAAIRALEDRDPRLAPRLLTIARSALERSELWAIEAAVEFGAHLRQGRPRTAADSMARRLVHAPPATSSTLRALQSLAHLADGDGLNTDAALDGVPERHEVGSIVRAVRELLADHPVRTLLISTEALDATSATNRSCAAHLLLRCTAFLRLGDAHQAAADLYGYLEIAAFTGLRTPLLLVPASDRLRLAEMLASVSHDHAAATIADLDFFPPVLTRATWPAPLTEREREVLRKLVNGYSITEIAEHFTLSPNTIKSQRASLYRKLGVSNRTDAALVAAARRLL